MLHLGTKTFLSFDNKYCIILSVLTSLPYDKYTKTVFEIKSNNLGSQNAVCGGGRYNHLVEEVGGKPTPAAGFGLGLERLLMLLMSI